MLVKSNVTPSTNHRSSGGSCTAYGFRKLSNVAMENPSHTIHRYMYSKNFRDAFPYLHNFYRKYQSNIELPNSYIFIYNYIYIYILYNMISYSVGDLAEKN